MKYKDYYEILGVDRGADESTIKKAYRKLAHKYHLGIYEDAGSTLHVHPGLGTTGPPIRLGVAPAIVFLRLRAG